LSWSAAFQTLVPLPEGGELRTLGDARRYVLALPNEVFAALAWQTVAEVLPIVVEMGGLPDFTRIGMMQALYPPRRAGL
jgi:hypothetical protein